MKFYLLSVKSTVIVNGEDIAFDYINTYYNPNEAIRKAKLLSTNKDVLDVSVHEWILKEDGTQDHTGNVLFRFLNKEHREMEVEN